MTVHQHKLPPVTIHNGDPIEETASKLLPLYLNDPERFERIVARIRTRGRSSRPRFPEVLLENITPVPKDEVDEFKKQHVDMSYIHWGEPGADERAKDVRNLQYARWNWACDYIDIYLNVLRVCGFDDTRIQNMLDGTPLCFKNPDVYAELRAALKKLTADIEKEKGWTGVGYVITGSSVAGFSQNPLKGVADRPTRITDEDSSDVDICIVGDGINRWMMDRMDKGEDEPAFLFPTTCSPTSSATRFGCRDLSKLSSVIGEFHKIWSQKLSGGLQLTFAEDDAPTPPWEARINISNV